MTITLDSFPSLHTRLPRSSNNQLRYAHYISRSRPKSTPKKRCFLHFASARWDDLKMYLSDVPYKDYCSLPLYMPSAPQRWLSLEWRRAIHVLSLLLMLKSLGLIKLVLVMSKIERQLTKDARTFELQLTMIRPESWQVYSSTNQNSLIHSVKTFLSLILHVASGILPKIISSIENVKT